MGPRSKLLLLKQVLALRKNFSLGIIILYCATEATGSTTYKRRREEAENGVVLHGGLYGPPYELLVGQNGGHGFSGKVISIIH